MSLRKAICIYAFAAALLLSTSIHPASAQAEEFTLFTVVVGEKGNIWLPSTILVEKGKETQLKLRNLAGKPHGFSIEALGIKEVIASGETKTLRIKPPKEGMLRYVCHLHKGHVGGQLLVQ